ncbi:SWR1 complex subunit 6 [Capsicum annuum]|uniref:SWR1 complex subunit 6 n=1 Tax=Capsicum annuum TaxID=4072 RepID=UPI001FB13B15|nr:SWR1 complex subunit 6 [Capsicum annuum]
MDEEMSISARRMSMRTRKIAPKMAAALASSDNRIQWAMLARLNALESDNAVVEPQLLDDDDDDEASLDDEDQYFIRSTQKAQSGKLAKLKHSRIREPPSHSLSS